MKTWSRLLPLCAFAGGLLLMAGVARAQLLITGNDEKVWFDETGKTVNQPPGKAGSTVVMTTVEHTLMRGSKPHDR